MEDKRSRRPVRASKGDIPESPKYKVLKIIFSIIIVACLALAICMMIIIFTVEPDKVPPFVDHFGVGLSLVMVGLTAILMTILNKYNVNSSDRGDNVMKIVGALLILFGIGTIIFSYL